MKSRFFMLAAFCAWFSGSPLQFLPKDRAGRQSCRLFNASTS